MKFVLSSSAALALMASGALAAGLDRSGQGIDVMFEDGSAVELSFGSVNPSVSGTVTGVPTMTSGNAAESYVQLGFGLKTQVTDKIAFGVVFDQPYGASVNYPTNTTYPLRGSKAEVTSSAITAILKYDLTDQFSVYGGVRSQSVGGTVSLPANSYTATLTDASAAGYLVGAAYEKPEIALRVSLTYNTAIEHKLPTLENGALSSTTTITTPKSINLDFQTGVAADTLVFGSIRWVNWKGFNITPAGSGTTLVNYTEDTITYEVGVGRRINDQWSGAVTVGYEKAGANPVGNLGPTNGNMSLGLGATYAMSDTADVTIGAKYIKLGDATTTAAGAFPGGTFSNNSAVGFGVKFVSRF